MGELVIKVHYPLKEGKIVLRTSHDWDKDRSPVEADANCHVFTVECDESYFYFKPCVVDEAGFHWSIGANYLAITNSNTVREVWPAFFSEAGGSLSETLEVTSPHDKRKHLVRIYHPPGYHENTLKRFPVLYMHDGQNLFFPRESFLGVDWKVSQTMDVLNAMNAIDKVIVIGVYPQDRLVDYTEPGYEAYGRFFVETLKPTVDRKLRTYRGARHTAVMGSSLGGVVSFYLAWNWPRVFGRAGCLSSTFGWRDDLFERVLEDPRPRIKIYLDSGWPGDNYEVTRSMYDALVKKGFRPNQDLLYFTYPHHRHSEAAWATRCHIPFQFFFTRTPQFEAIRSQPMPSGEQQLLIT